MMEERSCSRWAWKSEGPGFESLRSLDLSLGTAWSEDPCSTEQQSLQIHLGAKQEGIGHHHLCLRSEHIGPGCIRHCKTWSGKCFHNKMK